MGAGCRGQQPASSTGLVEKNYSLSRSSAWENGGGGGALGSSGHLADGKLVSFRLVVLVGVLQVLCPLTAIILAENRAWNNGPFRAWREGIDFSRNF